MVNNITVVVIIDHIDQLAQSMIVNSNIDCSGYQNYDLKCYLNGGYLSSELESSLDQRILNNLQILPLELSVSEILNKALREFSGEYFCFMPTNLYLENNWLSKMLFSFSEIDNLGITIISDRKEGYHTNLLSTSGVDLISAINPFEGSEYGCWLISFLLIDEIGAFNENLHSNWQFSDYCRRAYLKGYNVVFNNSNAVKVDIENISAWFTSAEDYENQKIHLPLFIKLGELTEETKGVIEKASQLVEVLKKESSFFSNSPEIVVNEKNDSFAIVLKWINSESVIHVSKFAKENNLSWNLIGKSDQVLIVFNQNQ